MNAITFNIAAISWQDRVTLARAGSPIADDLILSIRDEAETLAARRGYAGRYLHGQIADAAQALHQAFIDCDPGDWPDYFDELDALLCGEDA